MGSRLKIELYCILCRDTLYDRFTADECPNYSGLEPWQQQVYMFFRRPSKHLPLSKCPLMLFKVDLGSNEPGYGNERLARWLRRRLELCRCRPDCGHCDATNVVNFAHVDCAHFLRQEGRTHEMCYHVLLSRSLLAARPLLPWTQTSMLTTTTTTMRPKLPISLPKLTYVGWTDLGRTVHGVGRKLPVELRTMIFELIAPGLFMALLRARAVDVSIASLPTFAQTGPRTACVPDVAQTDPSTGSPDFAQTDPGTASQPDFAHTSPSTASVSDFAHTSPSSVCISDFAQTGPNISKLEFSAGETKALYASSTTILGEACLRQVSSEPLDLRIDIESRPVWGLQATLGTYGVCGLRVLYLDGSRSPWLGSGEGQLFSTLECRDRMVLELHSDGFKIVRLHVPALGGKAPESAEQGSAAPVLWVRRDDLDGPDTALRHKLIDCHLSSPHFPGPRILGYPKTRVAQYLEIPSQGRGIDSITVYCTPRGIGQIRLNGSQHDTIGISLPKAACPITAYFHPREFITTLFHIAPEFNHRWPTEGPYIMIATSLGRLLYFGDHGLLQSFCPPRFKSRAYGVKDHGRGPVVGLCIDVNTASFDGLRSIGTTRPHIVDAQEPEYAFPETLAFPVSRRGESGFLSKALLREVKTLHVRRDDDRCLGLCILHHDGRRETLGRWDPSETEGVEKIYDAGANGDNPLKCLTFILPARNTYARKRILDIYPGPPRKHEGYAFIWDDMDQELAWSYTLDRDYLGPYDDTTRTMPVYYKTPLERRLEPGAVEDPLARWNTLKNRWRC